MKNKLKILLITLIVILISAVSFVGIYVKNLNSYTNIINDYMLARNLKGIRVVELKTNKELEETVTENITEENVQENKISKEDLKTAKKILNERLKKLGSEDYVIEQNKETGDTTIYLNEDNLTDSITSYLSNVGEFKIIDANDENNILMSNEDIKDVKVGYSSTEAGTTVYLSIEFNKEGKKKLEEISNTYTKIETQEENTTENEVVAEETSTEAEDTDTQKEVTLKIDDTEIMTTYFDETVTNGILQMSIGSSSKNMSELQQYITQANSIAVILNAGKMPIAYTMQRNEYVSVDMKQNIQIATIVLAGISLFAYIVVIIRYRAKGLKVAISFIGMAAIFLLIVRYVNIYIAIESIVAFIILIIVNTYLNWLILKNSEENKILPSILNAYKKSAKITIPLLIITVILCFIRWTPISSIGMLLFWGLISTVITNFAITLPMLNNEK